MVNNFPEKNHPQKPEDTQKLIVRYARRRQKLREREALDGKNTPPEILMEIEDIEEKLRQLGAELNAELVILYQKAVIDELKNAKVQLNEKAIQRIAEILYDKFIEIVIPKVVDVGGQVYGKMVGSLYIEIVQKDQQIAQLEESLAILWNRLSATEKERLDPKITKRIENILRSAE